METTWSVPPKETIVEHLTHRRWSQRDLCRASGLTPKDVSLLCSGQIRITTRIALALEKALQRPARFWLVLQIDRDLFEARLKT